MFRSDLSVKAPVLFSKERNILDVSSSNVDSISPIPEWDGRNEMSRVLSLLCLLVVLVVDFHSLGFTYVFCVILILFFGLLTILVFYFVVISGTYTNGGPTAINVGDSIVIPRRG